MVETTTSRSTGAAGGGRYRSLLAVTTVAVYLTVLLGVSTRATGAGLACNAQWPLCDGGLLNAFPASVPSAFEWIHRVVAMVTGFLILGSAVGAWRGATTDRRIRWAVTLGLVLLPLQVLLGRETVLSFTPPVLAAHYWTAMGIYGAFVVGTALAWRDALDARFVRRAVVLAAVLVPVQAVLSPPIVARYSPPVQAAQYAVILLLLAALIAATSASRGSRWTTVLGLATALVPVVVFLGRQRIVNPLPALAIAHSVATVLLFGAVVVLAVRFLRDPRPT